MPLGGDCDLSPLSLRFGCSPDTFHLHRNCGLDTPLLDLRNLTLHIPYNFIDANERTLGSRSET